MQEVTHKGPPDPMGVVVPVSVRCSQTRAVSLL